jgi:hypothetical protein
MTTQLQQPPSTLQQPLEPTTDESEGFALINTPLPIYDPQSELAALRGIILGRSVHPMTAAAFYIVKLTEPCEYCIVDGDHDEHEAGTAVIVWETVELIAMHAFAPTFAVHPSLRNEVCRMAWEIKLLPYERLNATAWRYLCKGRQLTSDQHAVQLQTVKRPAPFPTPEVIRTRAELGLEPPNINTDTGSIPVELAILSRIQDMFSNMTAEQIEKVMTIADTFKESQVSSEGKAADSD